METSISPTTQLGVQDEWFVLPFSKITDLDSLRIETPSKFSFELTGRSETQEFMVAILQGGNSIVCPDGSRVTVIWDIDEIICVDTDPWRNAGFSIGDFVCSARELVLITAMNLKYMK